MNDRAILTFLLVLPFCVFCQDITFHPERDGVEKKRVFRGEKIIIATDSAWVYSSGLEKKMNELSREYVRCLEARDEDLAGIKSILLSLEEGYSEVDRLLGESEILNEETLQELNRQAGQIMENMKRDIQSLEELKNEIDLAARKLEGIKKEIKKERRRTGWRTAGVVIGSLAAGLFIGILIGA